MSALFNRDFALKIGKWALETRPASQNKGEDAQAKISLDLDFTIEKTIAKEPNTAEIVLYNLREDHRKTLAEACKPNSMTVLPISIEAGYVGSREMLFVGDIEIASSRREGSNWMTRIEARDGGNKYASKRFSKAYGPMTSLAPILKDVVLAWGIGAGNLFTMISQNSRGLNIYYNGVSVEGRVSDIVDKFLCSAGFAWSIQDGSLQVRHPGKPNSEPTVLLSASSGLIGSPEVGEKGKISAVSLLQGSIRPGRRVSLKSETVTGVFVVERVTYSGAKYQQEWYASFDAKPEKLS